MVEVNEKALENILNEFEDDQNGKTLSYFMKNFFQNTKQHDLDISYWYFLLMIEHAPLETKLMDNSLFLCYNFSKITYSRILDLIHYEELYKRFFIKHPVDERNLAHYKTAEDKDLIYKYTAEDAVQDGVFMRIGKFGFTQMYITSNLFNQGYEENEKLEQLVERGLEKLFEKNNEDTRYLRLRVLEKNKIWMAQTGEGVTFMKPEDY